MPVLIQRHSPSSINARIDDGITRLLEAIDKKNQEDPGWQEREAEAKRERALRGEHHEHVGVMSRIFSSMAIMVESL